MTYELSKTPKKERLTPCSLFQRYYFCPPAYISAIVASDRSITMSQQTQKKILNLFLPQDYDFQAFLDEYLPNFITLGPGAKGSYFGAGSYVAVNPSRIVEIYSDSSNPGGRTQVDVEHDVAGRGDHADGESVRQFTIEMPVWEVLARVDPVGYRRMLATMPDLDIGFGIRLRNYPRVDYPRLVVSSMPATMQRR